MSGQRRWWSGHELYGNRPEQYRFREDVYQEYPYIDLSPQNEEEMELAYWKSIYPEKVKRIQQRVEDVCEEMEYVNSPMYDEYPDRVYLRTLGNRIYEEMMQEEAELESEEMRPERQPDGWRPGPPPGSRPPQPPPGSRPPQPPPGSRPPQPPPGPRPPQPPPGDSWMRDMIDVLLFQEMHRRRCRRGRCGRRWY